MVSQGGAKYFIMYPVILLNIPIKFNIFKIFKYIIYIVIYIIYISQLYLIYQIVLKKNNIQIYLEVPNT